MKRKILIGIVGLCLALLIGAGGWYGGIKWYSANQGVATIQVNSDELSSIEYTMASTIAVRKGPDLLGKVKSVKENEIVVNVLQFPDKPADPPPPGEKKGKLEKLQSLKLTGETITIAVPKDVSIKVGKRGETAREIKVSDIRAGDFVLVWYDIASGNDNTAAIRCIKVIQQTK